MWWWKEFLTKKDFPIRFPIKVKVFDSCDLVDDLALQKGFKPIEPIHDIQIRDIQIYELLTDKDGVAHTSKEASLTGFKDGKVHFVGGILSPDKSTILNPGEGLRAGENNLYLHSGWINRLADSDHIENSITTLGDQIKLLNLKVERILREADCIVGFYMINLFAIAYTIYAKDSGKS
jgi:hypothetical protein